MQHVSMTRLTSNTELVTSSAQYHMAALIFILMFYKNNLTFHSHQTNLTVHCTTVLTGHWHFMLVCRSALKRGQMKLKPAAEVSL